MFFLVIDLITHIKLEDNMTMSFLGRICIFLCFVLCANTLFAQVTINSIALKHNMTVDTVYASYNILEFDGGSDYGFENSIISGYIIFGQLKGDIKWSMYQFIMPKSDIIAEAVERVYDREGNTVTEGVWERKLIDNTSENPVYDTIIDNDFMEQLSNTLDPKDLVKYCEKKDIVSGKEYLPNKENGSSIINYGDIYVNLNNMIPYNEPLSEECHSDNNILFIKFPKDDQKGYVTGTFSQLNISNKKSKNKSYISFDSTIYIDSIIYIEPLDDINSDCVHKAILFKDYDHHIWYASSSSAFMISIDNISLEQVKYIPLCNYLIVYNPNDKNKNYNIFSQNNTSGIKANIGNDLTFSDNILILPNAGSGTSIIDHNYVLYVSNNAKTGIKESKILDLETGKSYNIPKDLTHNQSVIESFSCNDEYTSFLLFTDNKGVIHYYNPDKKKIQKAKIKKCENDY